MDDSPINCFSDEGIYAPRKTRPIAMFHKMENVKHQPPKLAT